MGTTAYVPENNLPFFRGAHYLPPPPLSKTNEDRCSSTDVDVNLASHLIDDVGSQVLQHPVATTLSPNINGLIENLGQSLSAMIIDVIKCNVGRELSALNRQQTAAPRLTALPSPQQLIDRLSQPGPVCVAPAKKRVTIIGLKPHQAGNIIADFEDCFELTFWNDRAGDGMETLRQLAKSADYVIEHKRHMGHRAELLVTSVGKKPIRVGGGVTSIKEKLTDLYCQAASS